MKSYLTFIMLLMLACAFALPTETPESPKVLNTATHTASSLSLATSNWGFCENLNYRQIYMLYKGAPWFSAKRPRRNEQGSLLYWLSPNPSITHPETITADDPLWNPGLKPVLDSLSTVGYDGDKDLYEMLPAYNLLSGTNPALPYATYNTQDVVLKSILGWPAPRPFVLPDPQGNYCYTASPGGYFDTPGFETHSAYFYDYCPFGTSGDRDWGSARNTSTHYPLGVAVHRESYAWPIQNFDKMIVFKNTVYNTSAQDTLYDVAICEYTDNDIGPESYGPEIASDDVSGYVKGTGYEFAYARDFDWDGGLSINLIGQKLYLPNQSLNHAAWYWHVGNGPDDYNPRNLQPSGRTSNEKYWLATGRNPNTSYYTPLRPEPSDIMQYEQPAPNDTRILNTIFGSVPNAANPNPAGRWHLPPLTNLTYYTIYFVGSNMDDLKARSVAIEAWIDSGFELGNVSDLTCLPYLHDPEFIPPYIYQFAWQSYSDPDHFEIKYKLYDAPANAWISTNLPGTYRQCNFIAPTLTDWYLVKVASVYNPGPNEVYLESETKLVCVNNTVDNEDLVLSPGIALHNYPNPFNPATTVEFTLSTATELSLCIYNLKGQVVKELASGLVASGTHKAQWDGKDNANNPCASGIYYLRLSTEKETITRKMLLMK